MTKWAYVENNEIKGVYDRLPTSWKNISGLNTLENDVGMLSSLGWKQVSIYASYDADKYNEMGYTFSIQNGEVIGTPILKEKTALDATTVEDPLLQDIRAQRDKLLAQSDIYQLGDWQKAFDETLKLRWLLYRAALRDVPQVYLSTGVASWPEELGILIDNSISSMSSYLASLSEQSALEEPL